MPEAISTPNLVALPITSHGLGGGGGFPPNQNRTYQINHYRVKKSPIIDNQTFDKSFF